MFSTEVMTVIICLMCVIVFVVNYIPDSFVIDYELYKLSPRFFKIIVIVILSLLTIIIIYINWLRPMEYIY